MASDVLLALCTCPDQSVANRIADTLVNEGLAACINQIAGVKSVYLWKGGLEHDSEILLLIKTTGSRFDALAARLLQLHPYELPEIIATPIDRGLPEYLQWVRTCISEQS